MPSLLLEILTEEIPAGAQEAGARALEGGLLRRLEAAGLAAESSTRHWTSRRAAVEVLGLPAETPPRREERRGPRAAAPESAVEGFLRSAGVARESLELRGEGDAAAWHAVVEHPAVPLEAHVAAQAPEAIRAVRWRRSMRWTEGGMRWSRPVRSVLCLVEDDAGCRPVVFELDGIPVGSATRGHPLLAPEPFEIESVAGYGERLRAAAVILDARERREAIARALERKAEEAGMEVVPDPALLEENANLVEWPVVLAGAIDARHLEIPEAILRASMRTHQRFFALRGKAGVAGFAAVADNEGRDGGATMARGFERVLRARLDDASYFWDGDRAAGLEAMARRLRGVTHHAELGTVADRVGRLRRIARDLAASAGVDTKLAERAAALAKADLVSGTVTEFPGLQGVVGGMLASEAGEDEQVANAVARQYSPAGPADSTPQGPVAVVLALAERCELLYGFFAAGIRPSGSGDPFALRRAVLGLLRILVDSGTRTGLETLFGVAKRAFEGLDLPRAETAAADLRSFALERLRVHLRDRGFGHETVAAILAGEREDDPHRAVLRVEALERFVAGSAASEDLLTAYRRCRSILSSEGSLNIGGAAEKSLFRFDEEHALHAALERIRPGLDKTMAGGGFGEALEMLAGLRPVVDAFFDRVTVNVEDAALRGNRLRLLSDAVAVMDGVAGLSELGG